MMIGTDRTMRAVAICIFSGLLALSAGAVDRNPAAASSDVVVLIDALQASAEPFRQLIADSAQYKLGQLGLAVQIASASPGEEQKPLPIAVAMGAAIALVCRCQVHDQQIVVTLEWYDTEANAATASAEATGETDLDLDRVLFSAFDEMLASVRDRIHALVAKKTGRPQVNVPAAETPRIPQATPAPGGQAPRPLPASPRVLLSGGFAPFLPTGAASYYFAIGYYPSLLVSMLLSTPAGRIGIGVCTGLDYFAAVGLTDSSDNYLIPFGADFRYELDAGLLRPFFHLAAGPALLVMMTGSQGTITNIMPFLRSGVGLEIRIAPWLGLSAMVDYDIYFEPPYLLMGFSPSLNMAVRP